MSIENWEHLTKEATKYERAVMQFLGTLKRPLREEGDAYTAYYDAIEDGLSYLGDARAIGQAAQGLPIKLETSER